MAGRNTLFLYLFLSMFILSAGIIFADSWTLMVYLDADNNLSSMGLDDVNEMEWCSDNSDVNIVVLLDIYGDGDTQMYEIMHDDNMSSITSPTIPDPNNDVIPSGGECSMGDWHTLDNFVNFIMDKPEFQADHYLLSIWDHGGGIFKTGKPHSNYDIFKGFCWDDHPYSSQNIKLWELDDICANAPDKIDVVGFDVCILGQIETGYQLKDSVDYCIASEANEPGDGWNYNAFDSARDNPSITPAQLSTEIVDLYLETEYNVTQACQDLTYLDSNLVPVLNDFAQKLWDYVYYYESDIQSARSSSSSWNSPNYDFYEFAGNIASDTDLPSDLRTSANDFRTAWETYIIAGGVDYQSEDAGYGATVWFPSDIDSSGDESDYMNNLTFHGTLWDEFLYMYADPYAPQPVYLTYEGYTIDDSAGNGDGKLDPGETADFIVTLYNQGTDTATSVEGILSSSDANITITDNTASFGSIGSMSTGQGTFTLEVDGSCPDPYFADLTLDASADGGYSNSYDIAVVVGEGFPFDDVESGEGLWTHRGSHDQWHIETNRSNSPTHSWKCGGNGSGEYTNNMEAYLETPYIYIPQSDPVLEFAHWYDIEDGGSYLYDMAYLELHTSSKAEITLEEYTGNSGGWDPESIDLSTYAGQIAKIVYHLHTDGSVTEEGWYVDDIVVQSGSSSDINLVSFLAQPDGSDVHLTWTVETDEEISGYNLFRREMVDKPFVENKPGLTENTKSSLTENNVNGLGFEKINTSLITGKKPYRYIDYGVDESLKYEYLLTAVMNDNPKAELGTAYVIPGSNIPTSFALAQNYPNPWTSSTTIAFDVAEGALVEIGIYDITGRKVDTLVNDNYEAGTYEILYDGTTSSGEMLKSGLYLIMMKAGDTCSFKKTVITR